MGRKGCDLSNYVRDCIYRMFGNEVTHIAKHFVNCNNYCQYDLKTFEYRWNNDENFEKGSNTKTRYAR